MTAKGFVEGRRIGTPDAKLTDHEIKVEDARRGPRRAGLPLPFSRSGPRAWFHPQRDSKAMIEIIPVVAFGAIFTLEICAFPK